VLALDTERQALAASPSDAPAGRRGPGRLAMCSTRPAPPAPRRAWRSRTAAPPTGSRWMQDAYPLTAGTGCCRDAVQLRRVGSGVLLAAGHRSAAGSPAPGGHRDPPTSRLIAEQRVTTMHSSRHVAGVPGRIDPPALPVPRPRVLQRRSASRRCVNRSSTPCGCRVHNLYGPTEAVGRRDRMAVHARMTTVPIGRPIANMRPYVAGRPQRCRSVVPGRAVPGRRRSGPRLRNRPDDHRGPCSSTTRSRPRPAVPHGDLARLLGRPGDIEFLGRYRRPGQAAGYRVELAEVAAAMRPPPGSDGRVAAVWNGRLVGYLIGDAGLPPSCGRRWRCGLPEYMRPGGVRADRRGCRSASGKADRRALPAARCPRRSSGPTSAPVAPWRS